MSRRGPRPTHSVSDQAAISSAVFTLNETLDLGEFYPDGTLLTNDMANLSTEPDAMLVKWESFESGRARLVPRKDRHGQFIEVRGTPDWVLEIVSRSSVQKDTRELRTLYHRAGVAEYWIIDARGPAISFQVLLRRRTGYVASSSRSGWHRSPLFGRQFRLERRRNRLGRWQYRLHASAV